MAFLASFAASQGWHVIILYSRPAFATTLATGLQAWSWMAFCDARGRYLRLLGMS